MEQLSKITEEALNRYFISISLFGYKKYSEVERLLVLLFIEDIILNRLSEFITKQDYNAISLALYCLYGSNCMIDYPRYISNDSLSYKYNTQEIIEEGKED